MRKGYTFYSDTDTEVAVKLIDYYYTKYEGTPVDAINHKDKKADNSRKIWTVLTFLIWYDRFFTTCSK